MVFEAHYLFSLIFILCGLLSIGLLAFLYYQRSAAPSVYWFSILCLGDAIYSFGLAALSVAPPAWVIYINAVDNICLAVLAPSILLFTLVFTSRDSFIRNPIFMSLSVAPTIATLYFLWSSDLILSRSYENALQTPWGPQAAPGPFTSVLLLLFIAYTVPACVLLAMHYFELTEKSAKRQTLLLIVAFILPSFVGIVFQGIIPIIFFKGQPIFPFSVPASALQAFIIAYALSKYGIEIFDFSELSADIVKLIPGALLILDRKLNVSFANPAAMTLFGRNRENLIGTNMHQLVTKESCDIFKKDVVAIIQERNTVANEKCSIVTASGKAIPVHIDASRIMGNSAGTILIITSVQEMQEKNRQLEIEKQAVENKAQELSQLNKLMIDRELKMIELKQDLAKLKQASQQGA